MLRNSIGINRSTILLGLIIGILLGVFSLTSVSPVRAALGGPVILGGDDLTDHGSRNAAGTQLFNGWLYIQKSLENLAPQVTNTNDGSVVVLGSSDSVAFGSNAGAAYHYAVPLAAASTPLSGVIDFRDGAAAINQFFADLQNGIVQPAIMVTAGTGALNDLNASEGTALTNNAIEIANFVNAGGGLMSHSAGTTAYGWLNTLLPGIAFPSGCNIPLTLTPAGQAAFPGLTNANISSGPCHNQFTGDLGGLQVLATDSFARNVIIGGAAVSLPGSIDLDPPTDTNPAGTLHTVTATVRDTSLNPIAGATVDFNVISGPNVGDSGQDTSDGSGQASFTYTGDGGGGVDTIEASFVDDTGTTRTATAEKTWVLATCDDLVISHYKTFPSDYQHVDITNVGSGPISIDGCSFTAYNVFTERSIGASAVALLGTLDPGETFRVGSAASGISLLPDAVIPDGALPEGPGGLVVLDVPPPADGTPVGDVLADDITGMVYLNTTMVFGVSHLAVLAHNAVYDCIYGGHGTGPFPGPFPIGAGCLP